MTLIERASDWLNPILVKESRQALKSRQFVVTFFLMLVASWIISVFGIVLAGVGVEYKAIGGAFFLAYYIVLAVAIFLIVPFGAFRSLLNERDLHTWEVLSITTLRPRQIVWGKLTSAVVQLFIYYSAITPFIAFANLLKGIDAPTIAFVLVGSMLWSVALSMMALTASSFGNQKQTQVFLTLAVLGGLITGSITAIMFTSSFFLSIGVPFDEPGFWWVVAAWISYLVAYCVLFMQIAVSQLTFDADNRSSGIRLAAAGVFWLTILWFSLMLIFGGSAGMPPLSGSALDSALMFFTVSTGIHWAVVGLFAATENEVLSRRVRRDLQRLGIFRLPAAPFIPGGSRGLVYLVLHLSVLVAGVYAAATYFGATDQRPINLAAGIWCYVVIYIGLGSALGRTARFVAGDFRPAHARVLTVLMFALGAILPHALSLFDSIRIERSTHPQFFVTDPFSTLISLTEQRADMGLPLVILGAVAVISLIVNLRASVVGILDVTRPYVPPAPAMPRASS